MLQQLALKYSKPNSDCKPESDSEPYFEYWRVVKYNYTPEDLRVLCGTISMIKSLAALLLVRYRCVSCVARQRRRRYCCLTPLCCFVTYQETEPVYAPKIREHVYAELQDLSHNLLTNQLIKVFFFFSRV